MFCIKAVPKSREILYHKVHISVISVCYKLTDFKIPIGLMVTSLIFLKQSSFLSISTQIVSCNTMSNAKLHSGRSSKNWIAYKQVDICIRQLKTD